MTVIINVDTDNSRVSKLRDYLFAILDTLLSDKKYSINANFLLNDINNYSVDRIPVAPIIENYIIPIKKCREVYEFRSRNTYGLDEAENLKNVGFYETLEDIIKSNNYKGVLPNIENIQNISCLNVGSLNIADTDTCEFSLQVQIEYLQDISKINNVTSL